MCDDTISITLASFDETTQHEVVNERFTFIESDVTIPFLPISINPNVPLLLTIEREEKEIEHDADVSSVFDPIWIIGVLMN